MSESVDKIRVCSYNNTQNDQGSSSRQGFGTAQGAMPGHRGVGRTAASPGPPAFPCPVHLGSPSEGAFSSLGYWNSADNMQGARGGGHRSGVCMSLSLCTSQSWRRVQWEDSQSGSLYRAKPRAGSQGQTNTPRSDTWSLSWVLTERGTAPPSSFLPLFQVLCFTYKINVMAQPV